MDDIDAPKTLLELYLWLSKMSEQGNFPRLNPDGHSEPCDTPDSVFLWFYQVELPHCEAIEQAANSLWLHEEEVFADMQYPANALLRLRIEQARDLIGALLVPTEKLTAHSRNPGLKNPEPDERFASLFDFPNTTFQEIVHWLLFDWWESTGKKWAQKGLIRRTAT